MDHYGDFTDREYAEAMGMNMFFPPKECAEMGPAAVEEELRELRERMREKYR